MPDMDLDNIMQSFHSHHHGRLQLIVGLCEKMGVKDVFNHHLEHGRGRPSDIPAGIEAEIMIAGICVEEGYRPLYAIKDYYESKDLEGIFHYPLELSQLNDDRFGSFLDDFYHAGCRNIFLEIAARAFMEYGIVIRNINYDTSSKVMWGEYEQTSLGKGKIGQISISFGYSKDNRDDKKQIKIGLGTTNGVIADAKVLSGNLDDKTYNQENLEDVDRLLKHMQVDRNNFYYIADSALFSKESLKKAQGHGIKLITRMPDNTNIAKSLLGKPLPENAQVVIIENARGQEMVYRLMEVPVEYAGYDVKVAVVYSEALEETKRSTCQRHAEKERKELAQKLHPYKKRLFQCEADAIKEIELWQSRILPKLKYHTVAFSIAEQEKKRPGRPNKEPKPGVLRYQLHADIAPDPHKMEDILRRACTFTLCSNDLSLSGEKMLREYKTQSEVERRFKVLKSPSYMNSLFLKTPHRVEALVYLLLICLMMLTVAERRVREGLKETGDVILGIERRKIKQPTLGTILHTMDRIQSVSYISAGKIVRQLRYMDPCAKKIIHFLGIDERCFAWNKGG